MSRGGNQRSALFSSDLSSRSGHEAIVAHFEAEIKFLDHMKDYMAKRAKVESDYASALTKIHVATAKFHVSDDYESPIKKAWKSYRTESESKAKLVAQLASTINNSTVKRLEQLAEGKRTLLKKYKTERFKVDSEFKQESGEIDRLTKTYRENAKETENSKAKYEEGLQKKGKDMEKGKDKYVKMSLKLHQNHNDYVLALMSANCHQEFYHNMIIPKVLNSMQELQEVYAEDWKAIMQEAFDSTNSCREEFATSCRTIQEHIDNIRSEEEYVGFVAANRKNQAPVCPFLFEPTLLEMTTADISADELNVNDLTYEQLQHKRTRLGQQLDNVRHDINAKKSDVQTDKNEIENAEQEQKDSLSIVQKKLHLSIHSWQLEELLCNESKLQKMTSSIGSVLDKLGNSPPPKFADISYQGLPSPGEFGQSTPEIRRSGKRISTLFNRKKRELPKSPTNSAAPTASSTPMKAANNTVNDDHDSDDSQLGEYLEPPEEEVPLQEAEWFHGTIDRKEVENLLKKEGDYLVRESRTQPGQFVLSTRTQGQMRHFIIQNADGLVKFEDAAFPSVQLLLRHHLDNRIPVTKKSQALLLSPILRPCQDKWDLKHSSIVLEKKLGQGHFGDVMKGILKPSNMEVAVKSCKESVSNIAKQKFLAEAEILKQYHHPNIVKLIGVCADEEPVYIVMELMPGGDFLSYLRKNGAKLKATKLIKFSIHAASGMEYLESKNCIHRDLAARNCLIGKDDVLKISDFGMSREVEEGLYEASNMKEIPVKWTSPEALNYAQYTTSSDIWSFGVLLWETFSLGNTPYPGFSNRDTREKVEGGYRMPPPSGTPPTIYTLMKDCWHREPDERPRFSEILRRLKQVQSVT